MLLTRMCLFFQCSMSCVSQLQSDVSAEWDVRWRCIQWELSNLWHLLLLSDWQCIRGFILLWWEKSNFSRWERQLSRWASGSQRVRVCLLKSCDMLYSWFSLLTALWVQSWCQDDEECWFNSINIVTTTISNNWWSQVTSFNTDMRDYHQHHKESAQCWHDSWWTLTQSHQSVYALKRRLFWHCRWWMQWQLIQHR